MLTPTIVTSAAELEQIAILSNQNLAANVSASEKDSEGFVTWAYTLPILQQLHEIAPSAIVKDGDVVAGYALVLPVTAAPIYPPLQEVLAYFKQLDYKGKPIFDYRFYVMGQVCVHPNYRGQGVFDMLYAHHRRLYTGQYDFVITEIATRNQRSQRAHARVGFETIHTYHDQLDEWNVVVMVFNLK